MKLELQYNLCRIQIMYLYFHLNDAFFFLSDYPRVIILSFLHTLYSVRLTQKRLTVEYSEKCSKMINSEFFSSLLMLSVVHFLFMCSHFDVEGIVGLGFRLLKTTIRNARCLQMW